MVRKIFLLFSAVFIGGLAFWAFVSTEKSASDLRIFSYSSFTNSWSAGPSIIKTFEEQCKCRVNLYDAGDSALLLQKLRLDLDPVDLVIGLDQENVLTDTVGKDWYPIEESDVNVKPAESFAGEIINSGFVAFDWSPMTFVIHKNKVSVPKSWDDLLKPEYKGSITFPDPRTSNIGWQFLRWLISVKGVDGAFLYLQQFKDQLLSSPTSWSASYGMFQSGRAAVTFSYLTSLLFHLREENSAAEFRVAQFSEGHPVQIEYMGIPIKSEKKALAKKFIAHMLSIASQDLLTRKNFMLPVASASKETQEEIKKLPVLSRLPRERVFTLVDKQQILTRWKEIY